MGPQSLDTHNISGVRGSVVTALILLFGTLLGTFMFSLTSQAAGHHMVRDVVAAQDHEDGLVTENVTYSNGDFHMEGTVIAPATAETQHPALVLVAGSGEGVPRDAYRPHAEAFARAGIVTLIYDKRSAEHGYSFFDASIQDLADDAIAGVQFLQDRPDVDPERVGLHGHSEGTWTVVVAANRSTDVDFIITSAASAWPPERTQVWMNKIHLHHAGVSASLLTPLGETLTRHIVEAEMFRLAGHDALGPLEQLDQPLLGLFPEYDRSSPSGESLQLFAETLQREGHQHYQLQVIHGADHMMQPSQDGFDLGAEDTAKEQVEFVPEYVETVTSWVLELDADQRQNNTDPPTEQPLYSSALAPLAARESWLVQGLALTVLILTFASYPVGAIITRLRAGRTTAPTRWPARILATLGLMIPVAALGYLGYIMFTAAMSPGPVVLGRPILWLLLQVGTVVTLICGGALVMQWWRYRQTITASLTVRFTLLLLGLVTFVFWAAYWGLFTV